MKTDLREIIKQEDTYVYIESSIREDKVYGEVRKICSRDLHNSNPWYSDTGKDFWVIEYSSPNSSIITFDYIDELTSDLKSEWDHDGTKEVLYRVVEFGIKGLNKPVYLPF